MLGIVTLVKTQRLPFEIRDPEISKQMCQYEIKNERLYFISYIVGFIVCKSLPMVFLLIAYFYTNDDLLFVIISLCVLYGLILQYVNEFAKHMDNPMLNSIAGSEISLKILFYYCLFGFIFAIQGMSITAPAYAQIYSANIYIFAFCFIAVFVIFVLRYFALQIITI